MNPPTPPYGYLPYHTPIAPFRAGFNQEGPVIEVGFPEFFGSTSFGAGFNREGPYMDDVFPGWFFGSPYFGLGPFYW